MQKRGAFLGDHKHMPKAQRPDVKEGKHVVVFVDAVAWDLAVKNAGEDCWLSGHGEKIAFLESKVGSRESGVASIL
jgi:hypothetical protein